MRKQCCDPCWALAHQGQEDTIQRIVSVEGVPSVGRQDIRANPVVLAGRLGIGETSTGVNSWFVIHTARQK